MAVLTGEQVWHAYLREIGSAVKAHPLEPDEQKQFYEGLKRLKDIKPFVLRMPEILSTGFDLLNEKVELGTVVFAKLRYYEYLRENNFAQAMGIDEAEFEAQEEAIAGTIETLNFIIKRLSHLREEYPSYDQQVFSSVFELPADLFERIRHGGIFMYELLQLVPSVMILPLQGGITSVSTDLNVVDGQFTLLD